jgi:hypothetical protein
MSDIEGTKIDPSPLRSSRTKGRTSRCYHCNGRFGLIRHRLGLRIPTKPARHSSLKPATRSDLKPAMVPI